MATATPLAPASPGTPAPALPDGAAAERAPRRAGRAARAPRRVAVAVHRWGGLIAGLVVAVLGLSGSALVFREEIDRALNPHLLVVAAPPNATGPAHPRAPSPPRPPLQPALDALAARFPGEPATRLRLPRRPDASVEVWLGAGPTRYAYVDPYTGRLLGDRRPTEFLTGWLFDLHAHLLAGEAGHQLAGWAAWALVALALTGLRAGWPGRGKVRLALTVARGRPVRRRTYDLHRAGGFWTSALLLVAGVTGASLVFHEAFQRALDGLTGSPALASVPRARGATTAPSLPVDRALAEAARRVPDGVVSYVYLAARGEAPVQVRLRRPSELHPNGKTFVTLRPHTGEVLAVADGPGAPLGSRLYSALYPLHIGTVGGTGTRVVLVGVGLAPAALFATGVLLRRTRRRGAARSRTPS
jgi:uncharacterized iron-regulated membrane protein